MKTNQFFATALAVLAMVGMTACTKPNTPDEPEDKPGTPTEFKLSEMSITLKVGETKQLTVDPATVVVEWSSSNTAIASVDNGLVTAVAAGNAIISATANGITKTCIVLVNEEGGNPGNPAGVKGSQIWPIILDGATYESVASKAVASFQPDEQGKFLYIWEGTYSANDNPTGKNFYGNNEGFMALTVAAGWSGAGFCLTEYSNDWANAEELRKAIVADPDSYFLHLAIKSTDNYAHCFYIMGSEATKFVLGSKSVYDGPIYSDFTRDGAWQEFDIPMSQYAAALANTVCTAGVNVFVMLSEGVAGAQLNLDAVYFYKK